MVVCRLLDVHGQVVCQSPAVCVPSLWQPAAHTHQSQTAVVARLGNRVA